MLKKKRILILSASVGSGHIKSADALASAFQSRNDVEEIFSDDSLDHTNLLHKQLYSSLYKQLSALLPDFLGWWYETTDDPWVSDKGRLIFDLPQALPLINLVKDFRPDSVICTHFMPAGIVSFLIQSGRLNTELGIVITDYHFHAFWITRAFHWYFAAQDENKIHMEGLGLPGDRIHVTGIPIDPAFSQPVDVPSVLAEYGLKPNSPTFLIAAGTLGLSPALAVVRRLLDFDLDFQAVVLCGKNSDLQQEISELVADSPRTFRVLGYSNDMPRLMAIATILISKPGGLTTAEALARGLPMIILDPIGGQEERNADFLLESGAALKCTEVTVLNHKLRKLLLDPPRLERMRQCARQLGNPSAALDIARIVCESPPRPPTIISANREKILRKRVTKNS